MMIKKVLGYLFFFVFRNVVEKGRFFSKGGFKKMVWKL